MSTRHTKRLLSPKELSNEFPLTKEDKNFIEEARATVCRIICGNDPRILLIVGPCSIHDVETAKVYAKRLKQLQEEVKDEIYLIIRMYFEKPRTKAGWKGLLYDPYLDGSDQIEVGLRWVRKLLLDITDIGLPIAAEIVEPLVYYYLGNLLSWMCIGSRTASSQVHRQIVSIAPMAVAFKNDTEGNLKNAINSLIASDISHSFFGIDEEGGIAHITSEGNPFGHIVLRGAVGRPNYDRGSIAQAIEYMEAEGLLPRIIVDCSHDNCGKDITKMPIVFKNVIEQIVENKSMIRGAMLESYLEGGNQPLLQDKTLLKPTVSITDPCIDWDTTVELILWAHQFLKNKSTSSKK